MPRLLKLTISFVLWWRSGFDLSLLIWDPEIKSCCRNALQGQRTDLSRQEALLIQYNTITISYPKACLQYATIVCSN